MARKLPSPPLGPENSGEGPIEQLDDVFNRITTFTWRDPPSRGFSAGVNKTSNGKTRKKRMAKRPAAGHLI
jgi:hypothetical protein